MTSRKITTQQRKRMNELQRERYKKNPKAACEYMQKWRKRNKNKVKLYTLRYQYKRETGVIPDFLAL